MYKKSSDHSQAHTTRVAQFSHANEHGIDPTAFDNVLVKEELRRVELVTEKRRLEESMVSLKRQIESAEHNYRHHTGALSAELYHKLQAKKADTLAQLGEIERELAVIKVNARIRADEEHRARQQHHAEIVNPSAPDGFNDIFHEIAHEMLAGPVYDRIALATIHRLSERHHKDK